jgi:hypothetical protein
MYQIIRVRTNRPQRLLAAYDSAKEALPVYAMYVEEDYGSIIVVDASGGRIDVTELTLRAALE